MLTVAIVGADGSGKSTITARLDRDLPMPHRRMYLGVSAASATHPLPITRLVRWSRAARGQEPRPAGPPPITAVQPAVPSSTMARLLQNVVRTGHLSNRVAEEAYQEAVSRWHRSCGRIVLYDRFYPADFHAHDLTPRPGMSWDRRLHGWFLRHCFAAPDLLVVLDGAPSVLHARKNEGTIAELASRRAEYLTYAQTVPQALIIGVDHPLDDIVDTITAAILDAAREASSPLAVRS